MIRVKKDNKRIQEEQKKKEEEESKGDGAAVVVSEKVRKSPGEIRLQKEIQELEFPNHASIKFNGDSIMSMRLIVDLTN